jgi:hypothetical protein
MRLLDDDIGPLRLEMARRRPGAVHVARHAMSSALRLATIMRKRRSSWSLPARTGRPAGSAALHFVAGERQWEAMGGLSATPLPSYEPSTFNTRHEAAATVTTCHVSSV